MLNETYLYRRRDDLPDRGFSFGGDCHTLNFYGCYLQMKVIPTDMRYNGAQITGVFNLPECFNSSNITDSMTLNIQGTLCTLQLELHALFFIAYLYSRKENSTSLRADDTSYID